jgi:hypothetical protein
MYKEIYNLLGNFLVKEVSLGYNEKNEFSHRMKNWNPKNRALNGSSESNESTDNNALQLEKGGTDA